MFLDVSEPPQPLRAVLHCSAMSAIRLPLLYAFAGGCLSNAVVFGLWRAAEGSGPSAVKQQQHPHSVVELVAAPTAAPKVEQPSERVAANAAQPGHDPATEAAPAQTTQDLDNGPTPAGSAVSDVLTRLEAAYRERVAAPASSTPERATAAGPVDDARAAVEPARAAPAPPVAEVVPPAPAVVAAAPLEPRAVAPAAIAPSVAPAAVAPQIAAEPAFVAPGAPPATEIHYGDVNQNTYITNIRQGDTYLIQMQQLAMLQYMQLLGASSLASPARHVGGAGRQRAAFPSGITNPDNPWGFHFAPPNLVR